MDNRKNLAIVALKQGKLDSAIKILSYGDDRTEEIGNEMGSIFSKSRELYDILETRISDRGRLLKAKREMERGMIRLMVGIIDRYQS